MTRNKILFNVAVAAATATVTSYLVLRYVPLGAESADRARIEKTVRDYLTKNPEVLVEMTNELDKRQAAEQEGQQKKAILENADAIFRSPVARRSTADCCSATPSMPTQQLLERRRSRPHQCEKATSLAAWCAAAKDSARAFASSISTRGL